MRAAVVMIALLASSTLSWGQALKGVDVKPYYGATYFCAALSADGKKLVMGGRLGNVVIWDAAKHVELANKLGHTRGGVLAVAYAPNGEFVVSSGMDRVVRIWRLDGKDTLDSNTSISTDKGAAMCVAVSPDSKRVAFAGWDNAIHLVNAANNEKSRAEKPAEQGPVFSLAFSPEGKWLASGGRKGTVQIWEAGNELKLVGTLPGHGKTVWAVAWTPDSTTLAATGPDNSIKLWNVADKKVVGELKGHRAPVRVLAFTDAGRKLVSGSDDMTVKIWDVASGKAETLTGPSDSVVGVAVSPDGNTIYAVSDDQKIPARVFVMQKKAKE